MIITMPDGKWVEVLYDESYSFISDKQVARASLRRGDFYIYSVRQLRHNQDRYKVWQKLFRSLLLAYARHARGDKQCQ